MADESHISPLLHDGGGVNASFFDDVKIDVGPPHFLDHETGLPEDLFIHCFSFLSQTEKNRIAGVNRVWRNWAYEPQLWPVLDLAPFSYGVHDQFMRHVMTTSNRFSEIRSLSLEGCNAITDQSLVVVARECRYLRTLLLTECHRLSRDGILMCIQRLPYLEKIELFGVTEDLEILDSIREIRPLMDFGSFWFLYCAEKGVLLQTQPPRRNRNRPNSDDDLNLELSNFAGEDDIDISYSAFSSSSSSSRRHLEPVELDERKHDELRRNGAGGGGSSLSSITPDSTNSRSRMLRGHERSPNSAFDGFQASHYAPPDLENSFSSSHEQDTVDRLLPAPIRRFDHFDDRYLELPPHGASPAGRAGFPALEEEVAEARELVPATCRFEEAFVGGGCWGDVKGRIVYSNQDYHRGGNYPGEILYSCRQHDQLDFKDDDFHQCEICRRLFREPSTWNELICKVCYDTRNLQNKRNWLQLTEQNIKSLNFADLARMTLTVADTRNLPTSLKEIADVPIDLDYTYAYENSELDVDDDIPMRLWWDGNQARIDDLVHNVRGHLRGAMNKHSTRALFFYDDADHTKIMADRGVVFDGTDGEEYLKLTMDALAQFHNIFIPVLGVIFTSIYFSLYVSLDPEPPSRINTIVIEEYGAIEPDTVVYLILMAVMLAIVAIVMACVYRCRAFCEQLFRKFLIADILFIITLGFGFFFFVALQRFSLNMDWASFAFMTWNFAFIGTWSFYNTVPGVLHRFYIVVLNTIMAIFITLTIREYVVLFVGLVSLADFAAMLRPRMNFFTPFLIPQNIQLVYATPRIFYDIDGLRLRASDFMMYGLLIGAASRTVLGMTMAAVAIFSAVVLCVFVFPFFSKNIRPLPFALVAVLALEFLQGQAVEPMILDDVKWLYSDA